MKRWIGWSGLLILVLWAGAVCAQEQNQCLACHQDIGDPVVDQYANDVHLRVGITCAECHGGDPTQKDMDAAMDPNKGYLGALKGEIIVDVCLRCHADATIMKRYGSKLDVREFQKFRKAVHGSAEILTCVTCHGVHEIRSPRDPLSPVYPLHEVRVCGQCHADAAYMRKFNPALPTDQLEKYWTSMHGQRLKQGDIHVATCSDCHRPHAIFPAKDPRSSVYALNVPQTCGRCHSDAEYMRSYRIPTDQYQKFVNSVHGVALLQKRDTGAPACNDCHGNHGAMPPGVQSISHVCGVCHALNAEYFGKSPHAQAFAELGLPQCETCHGNHDVQPATFEMLNVEANSVCADCHEEGERAFTVAQQIFEMVRNLQSRAERAQALLQEAEHKGMDVEDARYELKDVREILIKAGTLVHTARVVEVKKVVDPGLEKAQRVIMAGQAALREYSFRRKGLGIATLFITLLVVALYLKIRQIEASPPGPPGA